MNSIENRIPPPVVTLIVAALMWLASNFLPLERFQFTGHGVLVIALAVVGLGFLASGAYAFRKAKTTIDPVRIERASNLVTGGVFGLTRNPMYVGFTCLLIGWAVFLSSWWLMMGPLVFATFIHRFQIIPEERVMIAKFGGDFESYRLRVRRWV